MYVQFKVSESSGFKAPPEAPLAILGTLCLCTYEIYDVLGGVIALRFQLF